MKLFILKISSDKNIRKHMMMMKCTKYPAKFRNEEIK